MLRMRRLNSMLSERKMYVLSLMYIIIPWFRRCDNVTIKDKYMVSVNKMNQIVYGQLISPSIPVSHGGGRV